MDIKNYGYYRFFQKNIKNFTTDFLPQHATLRANYSNTARTHDYASVYRTRPNKTNIRHHARYKNIARARMAIHIYSN